MNIRYPIYEGVYRILTLDFQNRFDKVCRIVFRFVHRPLADSFRRNLLQNGNASAFPDFSVSFKT